MAFSALTMISFFLGFVYSNEISVTGYIHNPEEGHLIIANVNTSHSLLVEKKKKKTILVIFLFAIL